MNNTLIKYMNIKELGNHLYGASNTEMPIAPTQIQSIQRNNSNQITSYIENGILYTVQYDDIGRVTGVQGTIV